MLFVLEMTRTGKSADLKFCGGIEGVDNFVYKIVVILELFRAVFRGPTDMGGETVVPPFLFIVGNTINNGKPQSVHFKNTFY